MLESIPPRDGLRWESHPHVYEPSHDSALLRRVVERLPPGRLLDVGTGVGLVALAAARRGHRVVATDTNPHAVTLARRNARLNGLRVHVALADLVRGLRLDRFDAVTFNPPYLPTAAHEHVPGPLDAAFDGGPTGRAVAERLLRLLPRRAPPVYVVASSLQEPEELEEAARSRGFSIRVVDEERVPLERLVVLRLDSGATQKA